jgi:hypothetical protein
MKLETTIVLPENAAPGPEERTARTLPEALQARPALVKQVAGRDRATKGGKLPERKKRRRGGRLYTSEIFPIDRIPPLI